MSEEEFLQKASQYYFQMISDASKVASNPQLSCHAAGRLQCRPASQRFANDSGAWNLEMPQSVQDHLRSAYRAPQPVGEMPDLVILTNEVSYSSLPGPSGAFALVYQTTVSGCSSANDWNCHCESPPGGTSYRPGWPSRTEEQFDVHMNQGPNAEITAHYGPAEKTCRFPISSRLTRPLSAADQRRRHMAVVGMVVIARGRKD